MLQPVRTKYRKAFKGRIKGKASRAVTLNYGQFGLKVPNIESGNWSCPNCTKE